MPGGQIDGVPRCQSPMILAGVTLCRADRLEATILVLKIVPMGDAHCPGAGGIEVSATISRKLRPILRNAEQRLSERIVVTDTWPRVRRLYPQPMQHRQHRRRFGRGAIVAAQHRLDVAGGDPLGERGTAHQERRMTGMRPRRALPSQRFCGCTDREPGRGRRTTASKRASANATGTTIKSYAVRNLPRTPWFWADSISVPRGITRAARMPASFAAA